MTVERIPSSLASFSESVTITGSGSWILIAGQVGFNEDRSGIIEGGVSAESGAIFNQIDELLGRSGGSLHHLVKLNAFMIDLSEYAEFSSVRAQRFPSDEPASAAVGVADLLLGARIEIDGVAFIPAGRS